MPPDDAAALARAVRSLLDDPRGQRRWARRHGLALWRDFSAQAMARQYEAAVRRGAALSGPLARVDARFSCHARSGGRRFSARFRDGGKGLEAAGVSLAPAGEPLGVPISPWLRRGCRIGGCQRRRDGDRRGRAEAVAGVAASSSSRAFLALPSVEAPTFFLPLDCRAAVRYALTESLAPPVRWKRLRNRLLQPALARGIAPASRLVTRRAARSRGAVPDHGRARARDPGADRVVPRRRSRRCALAGRVPGLRDDGAGAALGPQVRSRAGLRGAVRSRRARARACTPRWGARSPSMRRASSAGSSWEGSTRRWSPPPSASDCSASSIPPLRGRRSCARSRPSPSGRSPSLVTRSRPRNVGAGTRPAASARAAALAGRACRAGRRRWPRCPRCSSTAISAAGTPSFAPAASPCSTGRTRSRMRCRCGISGTCSPTRSHIWTAQPARTPASSTSPGCSAASCPYPRSCFAGRGRPWRRSGSLPMRSRRWRRCAGSTKAWAITSARAPSGSTLRARAGKDAVRADRRAGSRRRG